MYRTCPKCEVLEGLKQDMAVTRELGADYGDGSRFDRWLPAALDFPGDRERYLAQERDRGYPVIEVSQAPFYYGIAQPPHNANVAAVLLMADGGGHVTTRSHCRHPSYPMARPHMFPTTLYGTC